jgi:hypothetical protein
MLLYTRAPRDRSGERCFPHELETSLEAEKSNVAFVKKKLARGRLFRLVTSKFRQRNLKFLRNHSNRATGLPGQS